MRNKTIRLSAELGAVVIYSEDANDHTIRIGQGDRARYLLHRVYRRAGETAAELRMRAERICDALNAIGTD